MKQVNVDVTQKFNNSKVPKNLGVLPQASGEQSQGRLFVDINGKSYFITLEQLITLAQKGGGGGTVDLSEYQKKTDETLETESKEIVGAINEVNSKTVDKINYLNFQSGNNEIFSCNEEGIGYENEYEIETVDGDYHYGSVDNRIPIVAGNNITFEVDEANQVVKINATGGGSTTDDSVVGTWMFKDEIDVSTDMYLDYAYYFNGSESAGISIHNNQLDLFDNDEGDYITVYSNGKWKDEKYKILEIIRIGDNHNGDDTWLKANAEKSTLNEADKQVIIQTVLASIPFAEGVEF